MTDPAASNPIGTSTVFLLGWAGSLAPEIVRLYQLRGTLHRKKFSRAFYVISFLYGLVGGLVACTLPAVSAWGAFYSGITLPAVVTVLTHNRQHRDGRIALANSREDITPPAGGDGEGSESKRPRRRNLLELLRDHADGLL